MTTPTTAPLFSDPAPEQRVERAAAALTANGFAAEILDDAAAARTRSKDLIPEGAQPAYGQPSAINRLLILNAEPHPGRGTVLLLREAIGF
jgi:hypothetical protein